jgi:prepilin-type N-terminal cleavage/methylation domain-containing protein
MSLMRPRGVTLVELLVALILFGAVGTLLVRACLELSQTLRLLQGRASAQTALDQGSGWLAAELSELGAGDLREVTADALRFRGQRFAGLACVVTATEVQFLPQRGALGRAPQVGRDSLLLLVDSQWTGLPVLGVGAASCGGQDAVRIGTAIDSLTLTRVRDLPLVPVRLFEGVQARFYASGGSWWLGGRSESAGEGIQPLAGPFRPASAVWSGFDSLAAPTTDPARVRSLSIKLTDSSAADSATLYLTLYHRQP